MSCPNLHQFYRIHGRVCKCEVLEQESYVMLSRGYGQKVSERIVLYFQLMIKQASSTNFSAMPVAGDARPHIYIYMSS